jgi:hypothetical protein
MAVAVAVPALLVKLARTHKLETAETVLQLASQVHQLLMLVAVVVVGTLELTLLVELAAVVQVNQVQARPRAMLEPPIQAAAVVLEALEVVLAATAVQVSRSFNIQILLQSQSAQA